MLFEWSEVVVAAAKLLQLQTTACVPSGLLMICITAHHVLRMQAPLDELRQPGLLCTTDNQQLCCWYWWAPPQTAPLPAATQVLPIASNSAV